MCRCQFILICFVLQLDILLVRHENGAINALVVLTRWNIFDIIYRTL